MSSQNAFEKRYVDPKDQSDVEGLLEHFNLPPKVIAFLRTNKRIIQITLVLILALVVGSSLYKSYRQNQIESGASSLSVAVSKEGEERKAALENVINEYSNTTSATWAKIELAHLAMKEERYDDAIAAYDRVLTELKPDNPGYALALFGKARGYEAAQKYDEAYTAFNGLKDIEGYQYTGDTGRARFKEAQGRREDARGVYGQYQTVLNSTVGSEQQKLIVEERIALLKTKK